MLYRALLLALAIAHAWNDCAFPDVGYYVVDEGIGISFAYGAGAMNGKLYSGGYYQGHLALIGVTDNGEVAPEPSATLWGDVHSDVQNLFLAENDETGKMTKSWRFQTTGIQVGAPGHGPNVARIQMDGIRAMRDKQHLAIKAEFSKCTITLPDDTVWVSSKRPGDDTTRENPANVQIVMKVDVSSENGVGTGTTGWARLMDCDHNGNTDPENAGGVSSVSLHGDTTGNMIVAYTGCTGFDPTHDNGVNQRSGRPNPPGKATGCKYYLSKLAAADGSDVWKHELPTQISSCQTTNDDDIFCGYTMKAGDAEMDFGNGVKVPAAADDAVSTSGVVKFDTAGVAQWAKLTHAASFVSLAISPDGSVLAVNGAVSNTGFVSRIDTTAGNEGNVLWTDNNGGGSTSTMHGGYRDILVTGTGASAEVVVTSSMRSDGDTVTLTDTASSSTTLRNLGHYEVYVAAFDAGNGQPDNGGTGKWAISGGGDGGEYFFNFASDPDTNDIYVGGGVYDAPEFFRWGDVKRMNAMYHPLIVAGTNGGSGTKRASPVGSTKAFTAQLKSTTSLPACLNTCDTNYGQPQASDVKDGHCYIERHCYDAGDFAPYPGAHCMKCDPAVAKLGWTGPDTTSHCFIDGQCVDEGTHGQVCTGTGRSRRCSTDPCSECRPSVNTTAYSPTTTKGCMLDMANFKAACYDDKGMMTMSKEAKDQLIADKDQLIADKDQLIKDKDAAMDTIMNLERSKIQLNATVANNAANNADKIKNLEANNADKIKNLEANNADKIKNLEADLQAAEDGNEVPTWAIAIIVVIGAMFLLVVVILGVLVSREQQGKPVFVPMKMKSVDQPHC